MTSTPHTFGADVARKIHAFEDAIDMAIAAGAELTGVAVEGRASHGLSAILGSAGLTGILETQASLGRARGQLVEAHVSLSKDARKAGLDWRSHMGGPIHKVEDGLQDSTAQAAPLRIVA